MVLEIERVLDSRFEFSLDSAEPISDNAPNLTTYGDICHFKTYNGANIIKEQEINFANVVVIDTYGGTGTFSNFSNIGNLWLKLIEVNFFGHIGGNGGGSGVTRFDALLDTFNYFGNNGKVPVVDEQQLKLIPTDFYNFNKLTQLEDVAINSLVEGKYIRVQSVEGVLKFVLSDVQTTETGSSLKKIVVISEENQTQIEVDNSPNNIFLFKNGEWQIQDLDYSYASGTIDLLQTAIEDDYFEIIPLSNNIKKIIIEATSNNQTEFDYDGNPAFVDAYLKSERLREGVDYTRTTFSTNNKIVIINQYLIDDIAIGDIIEIITY